MASTFEDDVCAQLLDSLWSYASDNTTSNRPFGVLYNSVAGSYLNGTMRLALLLSA